jgi:hypothetical protein
MTKLLSAVLMASAFLSTSAMGADYCGLTGDPRLKLATDLTGTWQAVLRGGMVVLEDGKVQPLPAQDDPEEAVFTSDGRSLTLAEDTFFPAVTLVPFTVVSVQTKPDFALPGESPLPAAELLAPEATASGLTCDPETLPQFLAKVPMDDGASATLWVFALTPEALVLVVKGAGGGQTARAVFDLHRAP